MSHDHPDPASKEQAVGPHRYRPSSGARALLEAAQSLSGASPAIHFKRGKNGTLGLERDHQVSRLRLLPLFAESKGEWVSDGGEHAVYFRERDSTVIKVAHLGIFGYVIDEEQMLDERTFLAASKLSHRHCLPSEYFVRWAVLDQVFGLKTKFCGVWKRNTGELSLVISQPHIGMVGADIPDWEQLEDFFDAHGFARVDEKHIADPRIKGAVWYRERDGLLMSDAFPRNFRVDGSGVVIPIDLIVNIVPPGSSKILPDAAEPFAFDDLPC